MTDQQFPENKNNDDRSEQLFKWLADQEPPLDDDGSDTAPARTAPRPAVMVGNRGGNRSRFVIMGVMIILLLATVVVTLLVFSSGEDEPTPEVEAEATDSPNVLPQQNETLPAPTTMPTLEPSRTPPPFTPTVLPTAAVDELAVALLAPLSTPVPGISVGLHNEPFTITGSSGRTEITVYTVQSGDTLLGIAGRFGLDMCTLVWSNPRNRISPLRPGRTLDVLPIDGVFYNVEKNITIKEVAEKTGVDPTAIINAPYNNLFNSIPDTVLIEGMKIVVPGGSGGDCNIWAAPGAIGSVTNATGGRSGGSLWGCAYSVTNPGFPATNPIQGSYNFFQGFSAAHSGVDLSAGTGTGVYAAGSGTVAFAGWNDGGYGNAIVIDHGGNYTLYGHLSAFNVSCGQSVAAGERIGDVGSTGRSSGPHLHFEIRDSGFNPVDPTFSIGF